MRQSLPFVGRFVLVSSFCRFPLCRSIYSTSMHNNNSIDCCCKRERERAQGNRVKFHRSQTTPRTAVSVHQLVLYHYYHKYHCCATRQYPHHRLFIHSIVVGVRSTFGYGCRIFHFPYQSRHYVLFPARPSFLCHHTLISHFWNSFLTVE
jgi:hypothetical protein